MSTGATGSKQGAFDKANGLEGDVIVETLAESVKINTGSGVEDRYALQNGYTFTGPSKVTLRTRSGVKFRSKVTSEASDSMFTVNNAKQLVVDNIILDGPESKHNCANGGIVMINSGGTLTLGSKAILSKSDVSGYGGAVYVSSGGVMNMPGGEISGNTAGGGGAGIYLAQGSKLYISGAPVFSDNTDGRSRVDIYIAGYAAADEDTSANSLVVNGNLKGKAGSIYVWAAESPRYKTLQQFAKFENVSVIDSSLAVFRNARSADDTGAGHVSYLYGVARSGDNNVYWYGEEGSRMVILRKVDSSYAPSSGKTFTVYSGSSKSAYKPRGSSSPLSGLTSGDSGYIWSGELPYGWYIIEENNGGSKKYFYVVVYRTGVYGTLNSDDSDRVDGYGNNYDAAVNAAKSAYNKAKNSN